MIDNIVIEEIRRLLREKQYSQRSIALRLGVSRGTVNSIATGRRPDHAPWQKAGENDVDECDFILPTGLPRRCPQCGAKVMMPCLACHVRGLTARGKVDRQRADPPQSIGC